MLKLLVLALIASALGQQATFENYKVFRVYPNKEWQVESLRELEESTEYSFWKEPTYVNRSVDVMVAPAKNLEFVRMMRHLNAPYEVYIENVQRLIEQEGIATRSGEYDFTKYNTLPVIYEYLENLAKTYPDKVEVVVAGKTYEGRELKGVKVSFGQNNPGVFIEGGIHAREWISPATVIYILDNLLHSTDANVREVAERHDWYIFPVFNPDGYVETHTGYRLWRKTMKPYTSRCSGADLNRNWDYKWMTGGASSNPCAETFAGPRAFSEVEAKRMSEYLTSISDKFYAYISFHSYSQLLLFPYGHTTDHLENYDELYSIGTKTINSLAQRYGTRYVTGNIAEAIYIATGSTVDWVKGTLAKPIAYTYELRDTGRHGFLLPPDQIIPTGEETLDSLITLFQEAKGLGYPK